MFGIKKLPMAIRLLSLPLAATSLPALAQSENTRTSYLEEVTVTAEKREASAQDTAIALSAFSGEGLERAGIDDAMDIQTSVPNMIMSRGNFANANIAIRGVGNSAIGISADQGTGVTVDGVYLNSPRIFETEFFDTERVEVLRGPQGTLYGRNTTGGVINVLSAQARDEFEANITTSLGNYDTVKVKGMINLPLSENVAQRFAFFSQNRDGFTENLATGNDIDNREMYALRSTTSWDISDDTSVRLTASYFEEDDSRSRLGKLLCTHDDGLTADGTPWMFGAALGCLPGSREAGMVNSTSTLGGYLGGAVGLTTGDINAGVVNPGDLRKVNLDFEPEYYAEETLVALQFTHDFANHTFTSITGYHDTSVDSRTDYDGGIPGVDLNYPVTFADDRDSRIVTRDVQTDRSANWSEQLSQEFRLSSNSDGPLNYTLGAFWMTAEVENFYRVFFTSANTYGGLFGLPVEQQRFDSHTKKYVVDSTALFGEAYYDLTDATKLTLGLRYTEEEKEVNDRTIMLNFISSVDDPFLQRTNSWEETTGKLGLDHQLNEDSLLYASFSRGYKGGGFNPPGLTGSTVFDPEYVNAFEVGLKNRWLNDTLQANFSVFTYDYEGLQVSKLVSNTAVNENVDSKMSGLESEFVFAPNQNWRFGLNLAWLNAEIKEFASIDPSDPAQTGSSEGVISVAGSNYVLPSYAPGQPTFLVPDLAGTPLENMPFTEGVPVNVEGNQLPNSPEFSVNFNVQYSHELTGGYEMAYRFQYYWQDEYYARIFNTERDLIDAWKTMDAQVSLRSPDDKWLLEAWVKNIGDDDHITGLYTTDATSGLFTNAFLMDPRTFGITAAYNF